MEATVLLGDALRAAAAGGRACARRRAAVAAGAGSSCTRRCSTSRCGAACVASSRWRPRARGAQLEVLPRDGLLRDDPDPSFVLDPVAAGRGRSGDRLLGGRDARPRRASCSRSRSPTLDLFGPPPPSGEELSCAAAIALDGDHVLRSDIEVIDASGRCRMRLVGWEDKRFAVPERFVPLVRPTALEPLSSTWERRCRRTASSA